MNHTPLQPDNGGEGMFSVGLSASLFVTTGDYPPLLSVRIAGKSPIMAGCSNLSAPAWPSSNKGLRTVLGVVLWLLVTATQAQVYKWTDAAGQVHYGDRPPAQFPTEQIEIAAPPPADSTATGLRPGERKLLQEVTTEERRLTRERQAQAREEARHQQAEAAEAARRRTRCEDYRRRLRRLEDKLVSGYRVGESDRLHDQRDDYQTKIKQYCD